MSIVRTCVLILSFWIFIGSNDVLAEVRLPDTTFLDWAGVVNKTSLADGSELSEYVARTFSGRVEGAMLALSFVPRFRCAPMLSLRLPGSMDSVAMDSMVEITVGGTRQLYRGYVDEGGKFLMFSLAASVEQLVQLRQKIDTSSRASFRLLSPSDAQEQPGTAESGKSLHPGNEADSVVFSLLGSQNAALAVETYCKKHDPVVFQPREAEAEGL